MSSTERQTDHQIDPDYDGQGIPENWPFDGRNKKQQAGEQTAGGNPGPDLDGEPDDQPVPEGSDDDGEPEPQSEATQADEEPEALSDAVVRAIYDEMIDRKYQREIWGKERRAHYGGRLRRLKKRLKEIGLSGNWLKLLDMLGINRETARNWMWYSEAFDDAERLDKMQIFLNLGLTEVYDLKGRSDRLKALEALLNEADDVDPSGEPEARPNGQAEGPGAEGNGSDVTSSPTSGSDGDECGNDPPTTDPKPKPEPKPEPKPRARRLTLFKAAVKRLYHSHEEPTNKELRPEVFSWAWGEYPGLCRAVADAMPEKVFKDFVKARSSAANTSQA